MNCSRECLSIEAERSITARDVVKVLAKLFEERGEPAFIRSDNGPEFVAKVVKRWLEASGVETLYIEPGSPWENAYTETFIGRFSDELLKREVFTSLLEANVLGRRLQKPLQPAATVQRSRLLDAFGVRGVVRVGSRKCGVRE